MFGKLTRCQCSADKDVSRYQKMFGELPVVELSTIRERGKGTKAMKTAAREFIKSPQGFLTIWGTNGNGKSTTAKAITNGVIKSRKAALYITAKMMVDYVKAGIGDFDKDTASRVRLFSDIPVLIIDELTAVRWTEWVGENLFEIILNRVDSGLGTVLIMDQSPADHLDDRIVSRISGGVVVVNNDSDFRPAMGTKLGENKEL